MENLKFYGKTAVLWTNGDIPKTTNELLHNKFFENIMESYISRLKEHNSHFLEIFPENIKEDDYDKYMIELMRELNTNDIAKVEKILPHLKEISNDRYLLHQFTEEFYNYWRNFERYLVCLDDERGYENKPYRTFRDTVEHMNHIFRRSYRQICENITGDHPKIYRQVAAGFQLGMIAINKEWECPKKYGSLKTIPLITQSLLYPPLIIDPLMNKRKGQFQKIDSNPLEGLEFKKEEWVCYPAKVGDLLIHINFHEKFMGIGCSLSNLFELASGDELLKKPDAVYAFGVPEKSLDKFGDTPTVFFDDEENDILVAAVPNRDEFGYFGYIKKMVLTLHNIVMMKRGRFPIHGAMVRVELKDGCTGNILILGDTGAGKSESLEAFRVLGDKYIRNMTIIFDDMGSLEMDGDEIKAYGTEVGAFVRLDDLQPGFTFGNLDRSIIMSPQKINARAVIPVTTLTEVLRGYHIDFFLYANNYEQIDKDHPIIERFKSMDEAIKVFSEGAVMSKGTTASTGLVHTYFANIFGPPQYKEKHEEIANKFFEKMFKTDMFVGQLRTRLGIEGFETSGPEEAAKALFSHISSNGKK